MTEDLYTAITAELDRREAIANAATPGPWRGGDWQATYGTPEATINAIERAPGYGQFPSLRSRDVESDLVLHTEDDGDEFSANVAHIALHDPADALRRYTAARRTLERHRPLNASDVLPPLCHTCSDLDQSTLRIVAWPCWETIDLADSLSITISLSGTEEPA